MFNYSKRSIFLLAVIGFVVLAIIIGGGLLIYQYFLKTLPTPQIQLGLNTQNQDTETADWQTYVNAEYGLSFKYPRNLFDFISPVVQKNCLKGFFDFFPYRDLFYGSYDGTSTISVTILCQPITEKLIYQSIENDVSFYRTSGYNASIISTLKIDGHAAYEYTYSSINRTATGSSAYSRYINVGYTIVIPREEYAIKIDIYSIHFISEEGEYLQEEEYLVKKDGKLSDRTKEVLSTFKFLQNQQQKENSASVINSVVPASATVGSHIEIKGSNFVGFAGDVNLWIENSAGVKGIIYGDRNSSNENSIRFILPASVCQQDTSYSGLPCPVTLSLAPGNYKIFVRPWNTESNKVDFTIK